LGAFSGDIAIVSGDIATSAIVSGDIGISPKLGGDGRSFLVKLQVPLIIIILFVCIKSI
jgi:hypothetical protein